MQKRGQVGCGGILIRFNYITRLFKHGLVIIHAAFDMFIDDFALSALEKVAPCVILQFIGKMHNSIYAINCRMELVLKCQKDFGELFIILCGSKILNKGKKTVVAFCTQIVVAFDNIIHNLFVK